MNKSILAQNITNANDDQWWIDHEAYSDALEEYKKVETELEDALGVMCAEKTGGFNLVNYRHSSGVYHEQETEDLHRRI